MVHTEPAADGIHTQWRWWLAVSSVMLLAFVLLGGLAIYRHDSFWSHALDLGYLDQGTWNTAHSRFFANSIKISTWSSYFAGHFAPAIAVVAPLFWLWDDVQAMLLLQADLLVLAGAAHLCPVSNGKDPELA